MQITVDAVWYGLCYVVVSFILRECGVSEEDVRSRKGILVFLVWHLNESWLKKWSTSKSVSLWFELVVTIAAMTITNGYAKFLADTQIFKTLNKILRAQLTF